MRRTFASLYRLSSAIYSSLLLVWFDASRPFAWPLRYVRNSRSRVTGFDITDFLLFYLKIFLVLTAIIFLGLWLVERLPFARKAILAAGGVAALIGFPLVSLYQGNLILLLGLTPVAGVCLLLWVRGKWPLPAWLTILLLAVYNFLCWFFSGMAPLQFRPIGGWMAWADIWIAYPIAGVCYSLIWASYFRRSSKE